MRGASGSTNRGLDYDRNMNAVQALIRIGCAVVAAALVGCARQADESLIVRGAQDQSSQTSVEHGLPSRSTAPADVATERSVRTADESVDKRIPEDDPSTRFVAPFKGVRIRVYPPTVEVESVRCLDVGYLEQIACMPGTREHEALVVVEVKASHVHAAMLMAGFEPGAPGQWIYDEADKTIEVRPPHGAKLRITMRYELDGKVKETQVGSWIRDHLGEATFPDKPWVFAGSLFAPNPEFMGPGEHYVADETGSLIGLVTFGDETIGFSTVIADQTDVQPAEWEVDDRAAPPVGTKVTIVITPWQE